MDCHVCSIETVPRQVLIARVQAAGHSPDGRLDWIHKAKVSLSCCLSPRHKAPGLCTLCSQFESLFALEHRKLDSSNLDSVLFVRYKFSDVEENVGALVLVTVPSKELEHEEQE